MPILNINPKFSALWEDSDLFIEGQSFDPQDLKKALVSILTPRKQIQTILFSTRKGLENDEDFRRFLSQEQSYSLSRQEFFQFHQIWNTKEFQSNGPENWTHTDNRSHPVRESSKDLVLYRRNLANGRMLSFRKIDLDNDLITFYRWHHQPRVSQFWDLAQPLVDLHNYLKKSIADPHLIPLIFEVNGEAVGYFEIYWTMEDRLGAYYDSDPYDRGFHFLIGNENFRGPDTTDEAIKSICHLLFLDHPKTQRVMAEPRHDNKRVLKYVDAIEAWKKIKVFDFPHKRALLIECSRSDFFSKGYL